MNLTTLTPKLALNLSLPHTKDVRKENAKINYDNIYDSNRLGLNEIKIAIFTTYGYEYTKATN